jgi:hypothetical protein
MEYDHHTQDDLRAKLATQSKQDKAQLISQGRWPPPWQEADFAIQQDEGRLLSAIADNAGLEWHSGIPRICKTVASMIGMGTIGNAKATVKRCIMAGYVKARHDREAGLIMLDLTDLGAAMLDLWEEDQADNAS